MFITLLGGPRSGQLVQLHTKHAPPDIQFARETALSEVPFYEGSPSTVQIHNDRYIRKELIDEVGESCYIYVWEHCLPDSTLRHLVNEFARVTSQLTSARTRLGTYE